jgi:hypothetical protein
MPYTPEYKKMKNLIFSSPEILSKRVLPESILA